MTDFLQGSHLLPNLFESMCSHLAERCHCLVNWPPHFFSGFVGLYALIIGVALVLGRMEVVWVGEVVEEKQDYEWRVLLIVVSDTGF